jgi:hypothetical protein
MKGKGDEPLDLDVDERLAVDVDAEGLDVVAKTVAVDCRRGRRGQ